ncbi:pectate lyase superfamily protein-domain-containing protein, partial [Corynascus similis CBS 632.67]
NGPVWPYSGSFEGYMKRLHKGEINGVPTYPNATATLRNTTLQGRQAGGYWLPSLAPLGKQPLAGSDYVFYRDVTEYGASNKGDVDVSEAINAAIQDGDRCGMECGNTFHLGAIIYFPAGTYKICTPIIQLYYTQFIGDPHNRPIIKGCDNFTGIALMDTDPYIPNEAMPDGTGVNWYINQNQFFRQIRNFVFDLTEMPLETNENGQALVPTGIHWQVSQACSLQNLLFKMPEATTDDSITHVGIFTENGSGGFVSDLEFQGGAIGWRVGSQQYTARGLKFTNCITSIQMVWDWGFNWQDIEVNGGSIALNISGKGGVTGQGIGSISLIDSSINNVPVGSQKVDLWATGRRYTGGDGTFQTGHVVGRPTKPAALLGSDGKLFTRSRPQYEDLGVGSFLIATENGCSNDGTGDNTNAINSFLQKAVAAGQIAYFPAGIYSVQGTVNVPVNSRILGASWSQIQATGSYFSDMKNPQVVVKVGDEGDVGTLEITDMIFSVKGPTAGAIMVEWNVKESSHGAAGMWDTHIRVGGALGSDLDHANCPKFGFSEDCITASLLLHVTPKSSGYFENVWAWVADHDNDMSLYWEFDKLASQISIYSGRGMLIESEGPCWFYGTGSEHTILYQYQLYNAKNIYMGHIQTETPYFQPEPVAPTPFEDSVALERFKGDPSFADCKTDACREAWGLRIIDSEDVVIHSAGMYSWFVNYEQECLEPENCQERIMQIRGSSRVAVFNVFTKGVTEVSTGTSNSSTIWQSDNKQGYTTEISVYLPEDGSDNIVYLGPEVYTSQTAQCEAPCTFVLPPSSLASNTTILIPPYTTSLEVGSSVGTTFVVTTTTITVTITPITTDKLPQSNVVATEGQSGAFNPSPSVLIPHSTVRVTKDDGETTERVITFPPWPQITNGPPDTWESQTGPWGPGGSGIPPLQPVGNPVPVTTQITGPTTVVFAWPAPPPTVVTCPPTTVPFESPATTITLPDCSGPATVSWACPPETTITVVGSSTGTFSAQCTPVTVIDIGPAPTEPITWEDPPYTKPPVVLRWTGEPLPTYTTWPPGELVWEEDEEGDDDDNKTTCKLWFFWVRLLMALPYSENIGSDNKVTYPSEQPEQCTTQTADICATTTTLSITTSGSQTITSTHTESTCTTIIGCEVEDDDTTATETTSCTGGPTVTLGRRDVVAEASPTAAVHARADCPTVEVDNSIIYPMDPYDVENLVDYLKLTKINPSDENSLYWWSKTKQVQGGSFTAFFFVEGLTSTVLQDILRRKEFLKAGVLLRPPPNPAPPNPNPCLLCKRINATHTRSNYVGRPRGTPPRPNRKPFWELSLMSVPPGGQWSDFWEPQNNPTTFTYEADDTYGRGQTIYMVEDGINADHPEFASSYTPPGGGRVERKRIRYLNTITFPEQNTGPANIEHGTEVTSQAYGILLGLAKNAELVVVNNFNRDPVDPFNYIHERYLASLVEVLDDVLSNWPGNRGKVIINMSFGWLNDEIMPYMHSAHFDILCKSTQQLCKCAASHNNYPYVAIKDRLDGWPSRFGDPNAAEGESIKNLIVVSGINQNSQVSMLNPYASWLALAPGYRVSVADASGGFNVDDGASLAAPLVAGTIAYWRGLKIPESSGWAAELQDPANVKKLVHYMHRKLEYPSFRIENEGELPTRIGPRRSRYPFLWTGRVKGGDCLVDPTLEGCPPDMAGKKIADMQPRGADCAAGSARRSSKRQDGDSCPLVLNPGSGDSSGEGGSITYARGTPSPTCVSGCGTTCSGYYCVPQPTGMPPDYWDPEDP